MQSLLHRSLKRWRQFGRLLQCLYTTVNCCMIGWVGSIDCNHSDVSDVFSSSPVLPFTSLMSMLQLVPSLKLRQPLIFRGELLVSGGNWRNCHCLSCEFALETAVSEENPPIQQVSRKCFQSEHTTKINQTCDISSNTFVNLRQLFFGFCIVFLRIGFSMASAIESLFAISDPILPTVCRDSQSCFTTSTRSCPWRNTLLLSMG